MTASMSRTDKTQPWRVKVFFYPSWVEEYHDHRDGRECDLPDRATPENVGRQSRGCGWTFSLGFMRSNMARCACYMCSYDAYMSVPRRKRERIEGKNYCRNWWREY